MHYGFTSDERRSKIATQHNTTQHNTLAKLCSKFFFLSFLATSSLLLPTASFANPANSTQNQVSEVPQVPQLSAKESYGCEAFLCFAGGLHEPTCQKTILQVKRDLIRGRGFPHCPSVANVDGSFGSNGSSRLWTQNTKKRVYVYVQNADGTTRQVANLRKR